MTTAAMTRTGPRRKLRTLIGVAMIAGCTLPLDTPETSLPVRFQLTTLPDSSALVVLRKVTQAWLELERDGAAIDTLVSAEVVGDSVRIRLELPLPPGAGDIGVRGELRASGAPVFRGEGMISPGGSAWADIALAAVPGYVSGISTYRLVGVGAEEDLVAEVRFTTGDPWSEVEPIWTSNDPDVVEILDGNRAVARSLGTTTLVASFRGLRHFSLATVVPTPSD
jgi:uncharacterized protein (DUF2126 family)